MEINDFFFDSKDYTKTQTLIGEGSFGKVYIVENKADHIEYAAKILQIDEKFDCHSQVSFLRESLILHQLNHPAVLKFKGINFTSFDSPQKLQPTIITEYLKNGSLRHHLDCEHISNADLNWTPTKKYITLLGVADALSYLHSKGMIHRDLKPENILMDSNLYPRVCDFGLSRTTDQNAMTIQIGTPLYMAPEISDGNYDSKIDVYSFSIIAYEIASGKAPYFELPRKTPIILLMKVTEGYRPIHVDSITPKMWDLLTRCWSPDPEQRPTFNEIFNILSSDFTYLGEDVDENEINDYLQMLKESKEKNSSQQDTEKQQKNSEERERVVEDDDSFALRQKVEDMRLTIDKQKNKIESQQTVIEELKRKLEESEKARSEESAKYQSEINLLNSTIAESQKAPINDIDELKTTTNELNDKLNQSATIQKELQEQLNKSETEKNEIKAKCEKFENEHNVLEQTNTALYSGFVYLLHPQKRYPYGAYLAFKYASEHGNRYASFLIGLLLELGGDLEQNIPVAIKYYDIAAEQGNYKGYNRIGLIHFLGIGCPKNQQKAFELFQKAAALNDPTGMNNIATFFEYGYIFPPDIKKAIEMYEKAAEQMEPGSLSNLGDLYEKGKGVQRSLKTAYQYYSKAAQLGDLYSIQSVQRLKEYA